MDCLPVHIFALLKWFLSNQPENIAIIGALTYILQLLKKKQFFVNKKKKLLLKLTAAYK